MAITLIAHTEVGSGGAADITMSSIPSTYDDLLILCSLRSNLVAQAESAALELVTNASAYSITLINASGVTAEGARLGSGPRFQDFARMPASLAASNIFGSLSVLIPNYKNSIGNKQIISESVFSGNSSSSGQWHIQVGSGLMATNTAVSSIKLTGYNSGNFEQYSTVSLYGIKKF